MYFYHTNEKNPKKMVKRLRSSKNTNVKVSVSLI